MDVLGLDAEIIFIPEEVIREVRGNPDPQKVNIFNSYLASNSNQILSQDMGFVGGQAGDDALRKFAADNVGVYEVRILADDTGIYNFEKNLGFGDLAARGQYEKPYYGTGEYLNELLVNDKISKADHINLYNDISASTRFTNNLSQEYRNQYFTPDEVNGYNPNTPTAAGANGGIVLKAGAVGAIVEIARQAGVVGDVLSLGVTYAYASDQYEQGDIAGANETWVKYLFETSGGITGGAFGFIAVAALTKGVGGPIVPVLGALAGGVGGSLAGAELGEVLYNSFPEVFDPVFDGIYSFVDGLVASGDSLENALAKGFAQGFGIDLSAVDGGPSGDLLLGAGVGQRNGNAGDDLLLGWHPDFIEAGEPVNPDNPNGAIATSDLRLTLDGGAGNDRIIIIDGEQAIADGGDGEDLLIAFGGQQHHLIGGSGDDTFWAIGSAGTVIETGAGADTVWWSSNVGVTDLSMDDRVKLMGVVSLYGGSRSVTSESEWAPGLGGVVQYGLNDDGELVINLPWLSEGNQDMFILNWEDSKIDDFTGGSLLVILNVANDNCPTSQFAAA